MPSSDLLCLFAFERAAQERASDRYHLQSCVVSPPDRRPAQMAKRLLGRHWLACLSPPPDLAGKGVLSIEDWKQRAEGASFGAA